MDKEITFTPEETALVIGQFNNMRVCPVAPDAIEISRMLQSVEAKMKALTKEEKKEK